MYTVSLSLSASHLLCNSLPPTHTYNGLGQKRRNIIEGKQIRLTNGRGEPSTFINWHYSLFVYLASVELKSFIDEERKKKRSHICTHTHRANNREMVMETDTANRNREQTHFVSPMAPTTTAKTEMCKKLKSIVINGSFDCLFGLNANWIRGHRMIHITHCAPSNRAIMTSFLCFGTRTRSLICVGDRCRH